jgi:hypothetical protein
VRRLTLLENYIVNHPWIPAIAWLVIYPSDYYLTLWGAKLRSLQNFIQMEGSYELNPQYQKDIDEQKRFSPTFVYYLILAPALFLGFGYGFPWKETKYIFSMLIGVSFFTEIAIHIRHIDNITTYRKLAGSNPGISGRIMYSRRFIYQRSAAQLFGFSVITLVAFALTLSPILLGGTLGLISLARSDWNLAKKQKYNVSEVHE